MEKQATFSIFYLYIDFVCMVTYTYTTATPIFFVRLTFFMITSVWLFVTGSGTFIIDTFQLFVINQPRIAQYLAQNNDFIASNKPLQLQLVLTFRHSDNKEGAV